MTTTTTRQSIPTPDHVTLADLGAAARNHWVRDPRRDRACYQAAADRRAEAFNLMTDDAMPITSPIVRRLRAEAHVLIADSDTVDAILDATPQGLETQRETRR